MIAATVTRSGGTAHSFRVGSILRKNIFEIEVCDLFVLRPVIISILSPEIEEPCLLLLLSLREKLVRIEY